MAIDRKQFIQIDINEKQRKINNNIKEISRLIDINMGHKETIKKLKKGVE